MSRRNLKPLNQNEIVIIELALAILEQARDRANKMRVDTIEVRLALRCLRPYLPEQWPLHSFWQGATTENDLGRSASCTASYNGIMVQLQKVGLVP